jgi:hypothetical protein
MRDRSLLEVERGRVFAAVRDLEDGAGATVLEQERLVALAAEIGGVCVHAEQLRGYFGGFVARKARRCRVEDRAHA